MYSGNLLLLLSPNSVEGHYGTQMPPTAQLLEIAAAISGLGEGGKTAVAATAEYVENRVAESLTGLQLPG